MCTINSVPDICNISASRILLNSTLEPDDTDFEKCLKLYLYVAENYEYDDVTSDRINRIVAGLRFLNQHFWTGNLDAYTTLAWIHNYPLEKLYKYGFIFAFPILFIYLFLLITTIVKSVKSDNHDIYNIGFYLLLIPNIISMAEPTFPFGPGTATIFNFIIFGIALRNTSDNGDHQPSTIINGLINKE